MKKTSIASLSLALFVLMLITFEAHAQQQPVKCPADQVACASTDGPTLEETRDWVVATLNRVAGGITGGMMGTTDAESYSNIIMANCALKYTVQDTATFNGKAEPEFSSLFQVNIPLASITKISFSGLGLGNGEDLGLQSDTASINERGTFPGNNQKNMNFTTGGIYIGQPGIDTIDYAQRLQKALVHAAALCRAQAAQQPSNEPF